MNVSSNLCMFLNRSHMEHRVRLTSGGWRSWGRWKWAAVPWRTASSHCWTLTLGRYDCHPLSPPIHWLSDCVPHWSVGPSDAGWSTAEQREDRCWAVRYIKHHRVIFTSICIYKIKCYKCIMYLANITHNLNQSHFFQTHSKCLKA